MAHAVGNDSLYASAGGAGMGTVSWDLFFTSPTSTMSACDPSNDGTWFSWYAVSNTRDIADGAGMGRTSWDHFFTFLSHYIGL